MPESRLALVSRHVVLVEYLLDSKRLPQYAAILIQGDCIREITEVLVQYQAWNPVNCEDLYISAGLIDCNVLDNEDWESLESLTCCAAAGGVTCMAIESSLYKQSEGSGLLYCDVGAVAVVSKPEEITVSLETLALKTYLCAPSIYVSAGIDHLPGLFAEARKLQLPLIVDASLPNPRMLFVASPYRNSSLDERTQAFELPPERTSSSIELLTRKPLPKNEKTPTIQLSSVIPNVVLDSSSLRRTSSRTLTEGIAALIKSAHDDISMLSAVEKCAYSHAGPTVFTPELHSEPSISFSDFCVRPPDAKRLEIASNPMFQSRMQRMRPGNLAIHKAEPPLENTESIYINHLANCPEHWETNGVDFLLAALKLNLTQNSPCRVHVANLSSAAAVTKLFATKHELQLTCETCAHYLYFSMEDVDDGNTRFKTFPPIRNKKNTNLLWDLLKVEAIDVISSHHSSIPPYLKLPKSGSFRKALNGTNGLGFTLQAIWTRLKRPHADDYQHYFVRLSKWMSVAPAKLLGIAHKKGEIKAGLDADLVVWAPYEEAEGRSQSRFADLSPYEGKRFYGRIHQVYVRGALTYDGETFYAKGQKVTR